MQALQLLLVLLGASLAAAHFRSGGAFDTDETERHGTCTPLVSHKDCKCSKEKSSSSESSGSLEHSGSGSGSGSLEVSGSGSGSGSGDQWEEGEYCFLMQVFLNYSVILDVDLQIVFIEWINKTQVEIVENSNLTEYQMLVDIWFSLQTLFEEYYEIEAAIKFLYIGDWGYVCDLEGLEDDIQTSNTEITIEDVIQISGGSCPLTAALEQCEQNVSSSDQAQISSLISQLTVTIEGSSSFDNSMVQIYGKFEAFFSQNPSLKSVIFSCNIEEYGIIESYYGISATYWRIDNFAVALGGSSGECELLDSLTTLYENTSYTISQRSDFKQLHDKLYNYSLTTTDVELRLEFFITNLYQFLILSEWNIGPIYVVQINGYGSIYDLIYAYIYCKNYNVKPGDFTTTSTSTTTTTTPTTTKTSTTTTTPTTTKTSTTTTTPTTTKTSTTTTTPTTTKTSTTTTTTKPTTTKPHGNCATVTTVNVYSSSTNTTYMLESIDEDEAVPGKWNTTDITQFKGYKTRIYNLSINTTTTAVQKFNAIKTVLTGFAGSTELKAKVMAIFIVTWGTIAEYCNCTL